MHLDFAALFVAYLKRASIRHEDWAEEHGLSQTMMSRTVSGGRPPDFDWLDPWAERLGLSSEERDEFIIAGTLAHCPPEARTLFLRQQTTINAIRDELKLARAAHQLLVDGLRQPPRSAS